MINTSPNSTAIPSADFMRELERARIRALLARDMQLLGRLHAAEYQLIAPSGRSFGIKQRSSSHPPMVEAAHCDAGTQTLSNEMAPVGR